MARLVVKEAQRTSNISIEFETGARAQLYPYRTAGRKIRRTRTRIRRIIINKKKLRGRKYMYKWAEKIE